MKAILYSITQPTNTLELTHGFSHQYYEVFIPYICLGFNRENIAHVGKSSYKKAEKIKEFEISKVQVKWLLDYFNKTKEFGKLKDKLLKSDERSKQQSGDSVE